MRINIILFNVVLLIFLFVLIYLYLYINYNNNVEKFTVAGFNTSASEDSSGGSGSVGTVTENNNVSTQQISTSDLEEIVSEEFKGMNPSSAFDNVNIIMAINTAKTYLSLPNVSHYGNGYYWINLKNGAKLLFVITDTSIHGGGWILALRLTTGSDLLNLTRDRGYRSWVGSSTSRSSKARALLSLQMREGSNGLVYNHELGLFEYNQELEREFNISSVGEFITKTNRNYDCKFSSFNEYMFKEVMVRFYLLDSQGQRSNINTYMRVPNRELDDYNCLNNFFKAPSTIPNMTVFNSFNNTNNYDLIRNFRLNIGNFESNPPVSTSQSVTGLSSLTNTPISVMSVNCLLGIHGTIPASGTGTTATPRMRYLLGIGVTSITNRELIQSSAVYILVPDNLTNTSQITITPCAFELYIK